MYESNRPIEWCVEWIKLAPTISELYDLCKVFGYGIYRQDSIPARRIGESFFLSFQSSTY